MKKKKIIYKEVLINLFNMNLNDFPKKYSWAATNFVGDFGAIFAVWWTPLLLYTELKQNPDDIFTV